MSKTKERRAARGEECTVRGPTCNYDVTTTVLAHVRREWNAGERLKPIDAHAVFACSDCHDFIDNRGMFTSRETIDSYLVDALLRTWDKRNGK